MEIYDPAVCTDDVNVRHSPELHVHTVHLTRHFNSAASIEQVTVFNRHQLREDHGSEDGVSAGRVDVFTHALGRYKNLDITLLSKRFYLHVDLYM